MEHGLLRRQGAPAQNFAEPKTGGGTGIVTAEDTTRVSRGAPYLYLDGNDYKVFVPKAEADSSGPDWSTDAAHGDSIDIADFYIAHEGDSAATINAALAAGKNLLLTPGVYHLADTLHVTRADTVVLGIGLASLTPDNGTSAIEVGDVSGVKIAGITVDAGATNSATLIKVGPTDAAHSDAADPTTLSDVFIRVGGPWAGNATTSIEVNSDHVLLDHIWAWRADHGLGGSGTWTGSTGDHGLVVNGDDVTATGLFVEHYQKNQVLWNGNGGSTTFYQSEIPYEVPDQASWMDGTRNGYASYRVADSVTSHHAVGMGVYSFFNQGVPVLLESGIQAPKSKNGAVRLGGKRLPHGWGGINNVVNDAGEAALAPGAWHLEVPEGLRNARPLRERRSRRAGRRFPRCVGEFVWSIDGTNGLDRPRHRGRPRATTTRHPDQINPVRVTDTRQNGPAWSQSRRRWATSRRAASPARGSTSDGRRRS